MRKINPLYVISLVVFGALAKLTINYIDLPEKPVCADISTKVQASGEDRYNAYYVECRPSH